MSYIKSLNLTFPDGSSKEVKRGDKLIMFYSENPNNSDSEILNKEVVITQLANSVITCGKDKFSVSHGQSYNSFSFFPAVYPSVESFSQHQVKIKEDKVNRIIKIAETIKAQVDEINFDTISQLEIILKIN